MTTEVNDSIATRPVRPRTRARNAGAAAALVCGLLLGRAEASEVSRSETLTCSGFACSDTLELKCTQASSMMCITLEAGSGSGPSAPVWIASAVATAPSTMLGRTEVIQVSGDADGSFCLLRPATEGVVKALLTIAVTGSGPSPVPYTARAQCFSGNVINGLAGRKTTLAIKQDQ